jgi:xanthine dehydrogenase YagS FAD-binding subunit
LSGDAASESVAAGTTKVDLILLGVERPDRLVDINALPLVVVEELAGGGLRIGELARMNDVARTAIVAEQFPAISQALLLGASEQLRTTAKTFG